MRYIKNFREGMRVSDVYLLKQRQIQLTKNGKEYCSVVLQDKTGTIDGKIWDLGNPGIESVEAMEYVAVDGDVTVFNNAFQLNIRRIRTAREGEYYPSDYLPVSSRDADEMMTQFMGYIASVKNTYLHRMLEMLFVEDKELMKKFAFSSAAKTIHHSFVGGLMEHTLGVAAMCEYFCKAYPFLHHDLLITAALCHDIGKVKEILPYPENDYSDEGQLLGHIYMGAEMIDETIRRIDGFPRKLSAEIRHCILAHHGELEYGSPKKPALAEAMALNLADLADSRLEVVKELFESSGDNKNWLGFNKLLDSNFRKAED